MGGNAMIPQLYALLLCLAAAALAMGSTWREPG
jgi:hypothetical protein